MTGWANLECNFERKFCLGVPYIALAAEPAVAIHIIQRNAKNIWLNSVGQASERKLTSPSNLDRNHRCKCTFSVCRVQKHDRESEESKAGRRDAECTECVVAAIIVIGGKVDDHRCENEHCKRRCDRKT